MPSIATTIWSGIGGAVFGAGITYLAAVDMASRQRFYSAAADFRLAFAKTLADLSAICDDDDSGDPLQVLWPAAIDHYAAAIIFRSHLPFWQINKFNKAWEKYYGEKEWSPEYYFTNEYCPKYSNNLRRNTINSKKFATKRIENLLKFTKKQSLMFRMFRRLKKFTQCSVRFHK